MLIAYIDETYSLNVEHAVIALVLPVNAIGELEVKLDSIVDEAARRHDMLSDATELHGYEIASGEKSWKGVPLRLRMWVYANALREIATIEGAALCRGSVDLAKRSPNDSHYWALTFALEQVDRYAHSLDEQVIAICDDVGNKDIYQTMYAIARRKGTDGLYKSKLSQFVDGLHFTPSHFSRLVQAADLLTYVYRRKHILTYEDPRAVKANDMLWETIQSLDDKGWSRLW